MYTILNKFGLCMLLLKEEWNVFISLKNLVHSALFKKDVWDI